MSSRWTCSPDGDKSSATTCAVWDVEREFKAPGSKPQAVGCMHQSVEPFWECGVLRRRDRALDGVVDADPVSRVACREPPLRRDPPAADSSELGWDGKSADADEASSGGGADVARHRERVGARPHVMRMIEEQRAGADARDTTGICGCGVVRRCTSRRHDQRSRSECGANEN